MLYIFHRNSFNVYIQSLNTRQLVNRKNCLLFKNKNKKLKELCTYLSGDAQMTKHKANKNEKWVIKKSSPFPYKW